MRALKAVLAPAFVVLLMIMMVVYSEGMRGIAVFLNLEALVLVVLGTLLPLLAAYPLSEIGRALSAALGSGESSGRSAEVLDFAADCALAMGWVGTLLGVIWMLASIKDVAMLPRRMALALDSLLFGLLFAKLVLAPSARRLAGKAMK